MSTRADPHGPGQVLSLEERECLVLGARVHRRTHRAGASFMRVLFALLVAPVVIRVRASGCVAWRQTGGCDPNGVRERWADKKCSDVIPSGSSGYCECEAGVLAMQVTCNHGEFT